MPTSRPSEHRHEILDQFTRQATPFATAPGIRDEAALKLIVECSGAGPDDTVLDVACGPGLVVAAFARVVRHATGIDITPAMLERARAHAAQLGLTNVSWRQGEAGSPDEVAFRTEHVTRSTCRAVAEYAFRSAERMSSREGGFLMPHGAVSDLKAGRRNRI